MGELPDAHARLIDEATAAAGSASLSDIQHVVILMQENRSFDHYFGTLSGVRGEWLTGNLPAAAGGINGPVGLGFRVPCMVISPFSRGGYVCSQRFDHTSLLRFIETRFGVEVPNLSPWRRGVTGDMTATLALSKPPDTSIPALPPTSLGPTSAAEQAVLNSLAGTLDLGIDYPLPTANSMPSQETSPTRPPVP